MTIKKQLKHYLGRKATRRIYKAMPWVGGAIALATLGSAARGKGLFRSTLENEAELTSPVGTAKGSP